MMPVYHQMGHDSENLLAVEQLAPFRGAILSPVNYDASDVASQIAAVHEGADLETIFDPQLYVPNSERGFLRNWSYFPSDVDTADLSSEAWWQNLTEKLVHVCETIHPHSVCSPAALPRVYTDDYFTSLVQAGAVLCQCLTGTGIRPVQTAVVGLNDLAVADRPLAIASILSGTRAERIYLVFIGTVEPRREMREVEELKGAMRLIAALEAADIRVLVGFSSSDLILWKHAGASDCASGKFFNLRRFTRARFEEPGSGGGQLPYWFEEALIASCGNLISFASGRPT